MKICNWIIKIVHDSKLLRNLNLKGNNQREHNSVNGAVNGYRAVVNFTTSVISLLLLQEKQFYHGTPHFNQVKTLCIQWLTCYQNNSYITTTSSVCIKITAQQKQQQHHNWKQLKKIQILKQVTQYGWPLWWWQFLYHFSFLVLISHTFWSLWQQVRQNHAAAREAAARLDHKDSAS